MPDSPRLLIRVFRIMRQKAFPLGLLLVFGEAAIWLSGKGSLGLMLLLALLALAAGFLGAVVRVMLDAREE